MKTYKDLQNELLTINKNTLIIGLAGSGKSEIINTLLKARHGVIAVAPSGIAAENIEGFTIQYYFGIKPNVYQYDINSLNKINSTNYELILDASILLIDEISMIRCELLDIVDVRLRQIRNNEKPFGGLILLCFGDTCQMEPVIQNFEYSFLAEQYPCNNGDYRFYNADVLRKNHYFYQTFTIYELRHDFRHKDDPVFMDILNKEIRLGKVSQKSLNKLNERVSTRILFDDKYQYLTVTNNMADSINKIFLKNLKLKDYISEPEIVKYYYWPLPNDIKCPLNHTLYIKKGMKVMFVKNDSMRNGFRWVNGTIGKVVGINYDSSKDFIYSVTVETAKGIQEVTRHELPIKYPCGNIFQEIATVKQFPFVAAWAISIDKSQGLTLGKAFIFLEKANRDNQLYVALSRVRVLNDLLLNRELRSSDIHLSKTMKSFNESISDKTIPVYYSEC